MEEKNKIKQKQIMLMFIGVAILLVSITGITFAFFNYTKTGGANVIKTGNIEFSMTQGKTINLQNVFPVTSTEALADNSNTSVCEIVITGRNTYAGGVEYLVSTVNATNTDVPVSILVNVENNGNGANDNLGTSDDDYFTNRNSYTTSHYKKLVDDSFTGNEEILVGYIASSASTDNSINGKITIRAYFDRDTIAITDTPSENMTWQEERTVMSTTEWNALNSAGISFQVRVEANEGIWVQGPPKTATFDVGSVVNTKMKLLCNHNGTQYTSQNLANSENFYCSHSRAESLEQVNVNDLTHVLSSPNSEYHIYAWNDGNNSVKWYSDADIIYLNSDSSYLFSGFYPYGYTAELNLFNTSNVRNMSYMFNNNYGFTDLSVIDDWDMSSVEDVSYMFKECLSDGAKNVDLSPINDWNVVNVANFTGMFYYTEWDRNGNINSTVNDIIFPNFTSRPGSWDKSITNGKCSGTYVPNS